MERAIPQLPGDDLQVAKQFYVDGLGFRQTFEATEDGRTGLLGLGRGGICLTIDCPMSGHGRDACVALEVESADAYYEEWRGRGVPVRRPPKDEAWGARTFDVIDPFGNSSCNPCASEGFLCLTFGAIIVGFHNIWHGPELVVTLLGWGQVLKGLGRFLAPQLGVRVMSRASYDRAGFFQLGGVVALLLSGLVWWVRYRSM
jgi:catechol 2,3-dioxygenase-like lactoylglutathione lyase family enzyme